MASHTLKIAGHTRRNWLFYDHGMYKRAKKYDRLRTINKQSSFENFSGLKMRFWYSLQTCINEKNLCFRAHFCKILKKIKNNFFILFYMFKHWVVTKLSIPTRACVKLAKLFQAISDVFWHNSFFYLYTNSASQNRASYADN